MCRFMILFLEFAVNRYQNVYALILHKHRGNEKLFNTYCTRESILQYCHNKMYFEFFGHAVWNHIGLVVYWKIMCLRPKAIIFPFTKAVWFNSLRPWWFKLFKYMFNFFKNRFKYPKFGIKPNALHILRPFMKSTKPFLAWPGPSTCKHGQMILHCLM